LDLKISWPHQGRIVQSHISDFGFEVQDSSNFQFLSTRGFFEYVDPLTKGEITPAT